MQICLPKRLLGWDADHCHHRYLAKDNYSDISESNRRNFFEERSLSDPFFDKGSIRKILERKSTIKDVENVRFKLFYCVFLTADCDASAIFPTFKGDNTTSTVSSRRLYHKAMFREIPIVISHAFSRCKC